MKKNVIVVSGIFLFVAFVIGLACFPKFLKEYEKKSNLIVKNNCKAIVQKVMEVKDIKKLENFSKDVALKLNETYKNPLEKNEDAFSIDRKCKGCVSISYDQNTQSVSITGYDKELDILCRTIVKPPSFVTYEREEN